MRIGLFYKPSQPMGHIFKAIQQGGEALGHTVSWRNPAPFGPGDHSQIEGFGLIVTMGASAKNANLRQAYRERGVPALVVEGAYLNPGKDRVSLGIDRHYWLPQFSCPEGRAGTIHLVPRQAGGDYILICGQDNPAWCHKMASDLRFVTDREIVFRPHPRRFDDCPKAHRISNPQESTLEQDMAGAFLVVCETSNVGNLALLAGKPVLCSPGAMYAHLANTDLLTAVESPHFPIDDERREYFAKLAWTVWEKAELEDGTALRFLLAVLNGVPEFPQVTISEPEREGAPDNQAKPPEQSGMINTGAAMQYVGIRKPAPIEDKITVITPTGDRPEALELLRRWMESQTRQPDQWLIIDDGNKPIKKREFPNATVIRRRPQADDPACTLGKNLEAAAPLIAHDKVLIMEDDDWYGPDYIKTMAALLDAHELAGISGTKYYHPGVPGYREMGRGDHASLSQTACRKSFFPKILEAVPFDPALPDYPECSVDMRLWIKADGQGHLISGADKQLHCSIKGLPGRPGAGVGHDKRYYKKDKDLSKFKEWCGDVEAYRDFIKGL